MTIFERILPSDSVPLEHFWDWFYVTELTTARKSLYRALANGTQIDTSGSFITDKKIQKPVRTLSFSQNPENYVVTVLPHITPSLSLYLIKICAPYYNVLTAYMDSSRIACLG